MNKRQTLTRVGLKHEYATLRHRRREEAVQYVAVRSTVAADAHINVDALEIVKYIYISSPPIDFVRIPPIAATHVSI